MLNNSAFSHGLLVNFNWKQCLNDGLQNQSKAVSWNPIPALSNSTFYSSRSSDIWMVNFSHKIRLRTKKRIFRRDCKLQEKNSSFIRSSFGPIQPYNQLRCKRINFNTFDLFNLFNLQVSQLPRYSEGVLMIPNRYFLKKVYLSSIAYVRHYFVLC